jgi:hypothetical protein
MGKDSRRGESHKRAVFPVTHCAHHYDALVKEWAAFSRKERFQWKRFANVGDHPVYFLASAPLADPRDVIYLSAGLHGDEPAPPWALLEWAQENVGVLRERPFLIFPCLNPHGLINNTRMDQRGVDLNRSFNHLDHPLIASWLKVMNGRRLAIGICLHEDYDAQGCYVYELAPGRSRAHAMLNEVAAILPIETRKKIEGRNAREGVITRRLPPEMPGHPEAIVLHLMGAPLSLTFETPSEFSLIDRIAAQKCFVTAALRHGLLE